MELNCRITHFLELAKSNTAIALVDSMGEMSFADLALEVYKLAEIIQRGSAPIQIIAEKNSRNHFITFFASVLSKKVYCPLDPKNETAILSDLSQSVATLQIPSGTAAIFYTSGSTGNPKGVLVKAKTIEANIKNGAAIQQFDKNSKVLAHLHFSHSGGFFLQALPAILNFSQIIIADYFRPKGIIHLILKHRPTHTILLPSLYGLLVKSSEWPKVENYQFAIVLTGSQGLTPKFIQKALLNCTFLLNVYGLTECGPFAIYKIFDKSFSGESVSMGSPVVELQWKINTDGELLVKGDLVSEGYLNRPSERSENEYFSTKDLVKQENNVFTFISRKDDLFQVGGLTVNPHDVEKKITVSILEVEDCLIFPIPHSQLVNLPAALIKLKNKELKSTDLEDSIGKLLEKHSTPQVYLYVDQIPYNRNGKPDRAAAIDYYLELKKTPKADQ